MTPATADERRQMLRSYDRGDGVDAAGDTVRHLLPRPSVKGWQPGLCGLRGYGTPGSLGSGAPLCDECWRLALEQVRANVSTPSNGSECA